MTGTPTNTPIAIPARDATMARQPIPFQLRLLPTLQGLLRGHAAHRALWSLTGGHLGNQYKRFHRKVLVA